MFTLVIVTLHLPLPCNISALISYESIKILHKITAKMNGRATHLYGGVSISKKGFLKLGVDEQTYFGTFHLHIVRYIL